jgi:hypothetical protein
VTTDGTYYQTASSEDEFQDAVPLEKGIIRGYIPVRRIFFHYYSSLVGDSNQLKQWMRVEIKR